MYYTIKIMSDDSELSLKTNDRRVIEKEVDIYFARMFGASAEFISAILDTYKVAEVKKAPEPVKNTEKALSDTPEPQEIAQEPAVEQIKEKPVVDMKPTVSEQSVFEDISGENVQQNAVYADELTQATGSFMTKNDIEVKPLDENLELEKEAQAMYQELQQEVQSAKQQQEQLQQNSDNHVDLEDIDVFGDIQLQHHESLFAKSEAQEPKDNQAFQDIVDIYKEQETIKQNPPFDSAEQKQINDINEIFNDNQPAIQNETPKLESIRQEVKSPKEELNSVYQNAIISSGDYLKSFATNDISDQFLISAMYSKKFMHEKAFTIKSVNSKLFQATGKIADTSIVDELLKKEYIVSMQIDDSTRYAIAPKGEEYLGTIMPS